MPWNKTMTEPLNIQLKWKSEAKSTWVDYIILEIGGQGLVVLA